MPREYTIDEIEQAYRRLYDQNLDQMAALAGLDERAFLPLLNRIVQSSYHEIAAAIATRQGVLLGDEKAHPMEADSGASAYAYGLNIGLLIGLLAGRTAQ